MPTPPPPSTSSRQENPLISILFNIIVPVVILNKLTSPLGPQAAMLLALAFPLGYGTYDFIKRRHKNYVSLLGIINILVTGSLALLHLTGFWFALKEAFFPALIGLGVLISAFTQSPAMKVMLFNEQIFNLPLIYKRLEELGRQALLLPHLKRSTYLLTLSFCLSSALNFILAQRIFVDIDTALSLQQQAEILNAQIARMTGLSYIVIVLPLMLFMALVLWHLVAGLKRLTGLKTEEIFVDTGKK